MVVKAMYACRVRGVSVGYPAIAVVRRAKFQAEGASTKDMTNSQRARYLALQSFVQGRLQRLKKSEHGKLTKLSKQ